MALLWGIDLGGTKIEGVVCDEASLTKPLCRLRLNTEAHKGYEHVLAQISRLVKKMQQETGKRPRTIGFATPGVLDPQLNVMKNCNTACLNGRPLRDDLEANLRIKAILANDANCFALAEASAGAARGAATSFGVIMGTGVGGGVVINGQALTGCQGIGGEWGHNILHDDGPECYCGKRGCVERYLSGPAIEAYYEAHAGQHRPLQDIASRFEAGGDSHARAAMEYTAENFGRAISVVINILDPDIVVLGGGVSNLPVLYTEGVGRIKKYVFNNRLETKILKNKLGDSAGVFGAAALCMKS